MSDTQAISDTARRILAGIERNTFAAIQRARYNGSIADAMYVVEGIGRTRTQRFVIDDDNRFAYVNFVKWLHGDPSMQALNPETKQVVPGRLTAGMYIAGSTGSGKSWLLEIMAKYASVMHFPIKLNDRQQELTWANHRSDYFVDEYAQQNSIDAWKKAKILGIQDLGAEDTECVVYGNRHNVLRSMLEFRGDRRDLITLITSNYPIMNATFGDLYGVRVQSRLCEMCNYFEIKGKDRRRV